MIQWHVEILKYYHRDKILSRERFNRSMLSYPHNEIQCNNVEESNNCLLCYSDNYILDNNADCVKNS